MSGILPTVQRQVDSNPWLLASSLVYLSRKTTMPSVSLTLLTGGFNFASTVDNIHSDSEAESIDQNITTIILSDLTTQLFSWCLSSLWIYTLCN